jgi:capsular exopolysaccharide synthesis family protein
LVREREIVMSEQNGKSLHPIPRSPRRPGLPSRPGPEAPPPWIEDAGMVHEARGVIARRWGIVAGTVAILLAATALYCFLATPLYRAQAIVLIEAHALRVLNNQNANAGDANEPFVSAKYDYFQTQFQLLRSRSLAGRVIDELGLARDPRFVPAPAPGEESVPSMTELMVRYFQYLQILPVPGTRLVAVQFETPDPDLAADLANAHARFFVRGGLENLYAAMEQIRGFLQGKLAELQPRMQRADRRLLKFQGAHQLLPVDVSKNVANERMLDLSRRLTAAEAERIGLEAHYQLIERREYESLPAVLSSPLIQKLREDYNRLDVEHALLAQKFRPTYPELRQLTAQLEHARRALRAETEKVVKGVEANFLAAQHTAEQLKVEMEVQRRALLSSKSVDGKLLTLVREAEIMRSLYDNILARVKELDVAGGADISNINVVEMATVPLWPSHPATFLYFGLSLVTGLLFGTGLAFLREATDRTIRDPHGIRGATGLGTLAIIPDFDVPPRGSLPEALRWRAGRAARMGTRGWQRLRQMGAPAEMAVELTPAEVTPPLLLGNGIEPPSAEAYRTLRTSLLLCRTSAPPRIVLVSSAWTREGKTTTAVNMAAALASSGAPVLLIDGDLRLPRCHETLGLEPEPGLSEYLAGKTRVERIQSAHVPNLSLLAAGRCDANPTEVLSSRRMGLLLGRARKRFAFVVIDSPPLLVVSDALLLANLADGVILVTQSGRSRRDSVRTAVQRLYQTGALPLGAVLNRGEVDSEYYRYSRYRYGLAIPETDLRVDGEGQLPPAE